MLDWQMLGGIVVAAVGAVSLGLLGGAGLAALYNYLGVNDEPTESAPPVEPEAAAGAASASVSGSAPEGRRFQIVRPADRLAVIHRRRQQRYSRETKH